MGEVYEADDQELPERVAIKIIRPEVLAQLNAEARFRREVHLARKVTNPNVCRVFARDRQHERRDSVHQHGTAVCLYGKTPEEELKTRACVSVGEALPPIEQIASALAAAHAVGVVHRDFKPGNVVL
jgi:eukaryotic-like serine/threonine-protein kinase